MDGDSGRRLSQLRPRTRPISSRMTPIWALEDSRFLTQRPSSGHSANIERARCRLSGGPIAQIYPSRYSWLPPSQGRRGNQARLLDPDTAGRRKRLYDASDPAGPTAGRRRVRPGPSLWAARLARPTQPGRARQADRRPPDGCCWAWGTASARESMMIAAGRYVSKSAICATRHDEHPTRRARNAPTPRLASLRLAHPTEPAPGQSQHHRQTGHSTPPPIVRDSTRS